MSRSGPKVLTLLAVVRILMLRPQGLFALKVRK
jgi:urea transport system permease protein